MEKKIASKRSAAGFIILHNKNASFDSSVVKSAFQNWPQRLVSQIVLTYPVLHHLFRSFSIIDGYR